jgi:hypothetical protein
MRERVLEASGRCSPTRSRSVEGYLSALVRAVRDDERDEQQTSRDLYVRARKRRRLGLISFGADPMVGVASRVADLYCETATVSDVTGRSRRTSNEQGKPPVAKILGAKLTERAAGYVALAPEENPTKLSIATTLWKVHRLDAGDVARDAKDAIGGQPIRSVAFTGHRTKRVIKRAEAQLRVRPEPSGSWPWR